GHQRTPKPSVATMRMPTRVSRPRLFCTTSPPHRLHPPISRRLLEPQLLPNDLLRQLRARRVVTPRNQLQGRRLLRPAGYVLRHEGINRRPHPRSHRSSAPPAPNDPAQPPPHV